MHNDKTDGMGDATSISISFCLPVFNVKPFLDDCIRSIMEGDLRELSYEILCIDDGSTDGSYEHLTQMCLDIPPLRVLKNESNRGVSFTRNRLMQEARGKYIWFVDPDDMLCKGAVAPFYRQVVATGCDVLLGNYIRVPESTSGSGEYPVDYTSVQAVPEKKESYLPVDTEGRPMCAIWAGLFLRSFLLKHALTMNEKMISQEDTLFYYEFSLRTENVYKWEVPCYLYRCRAGSVMHTHNDERSKKYYVSMLEMLRVYQEHLAKKDYKDEQGLLRKIHHSKQNVATCLAAIHDKAYIKEQLRALKKEKIYPYKFRFSVLRSPMPLPLRILTFLTPIRLFFWLYHYVYVTYDKRRSS